MPIVKLFHIEGFIANDDALVQLDFICLQIDFEP